MSTTITLHASAFRSGNGFGASLDCDTYSTLRLQLDVTGNTAAGDAVTDDNVRKSPLFECTIETSADNTTWRPHTKFASGAKIRTERVTTSGFDRYVRVRYDLHPFNGPQGYPVGVTFAVTGAAV